MIILVLGMHRSGTSAITRTLALMGAGIPGTLMAPVVDDNPFGFWESREIMEIHDRFLAAVKSHWQDMRPLPERAFRGSAARRCRDELASLLRSALAKSPLLVVKDPRLCRLMPLWRPLLRTLGEESRAVLPLRNPLEVAGSLEKRNGIEPERALTMWLVHTLSAERESRGIPRRFVSYAAFLASPREKAAELAEGLGLFDAAEVHSALPAIEAFWREDLRHHVQDDAELAADPDIPIWVREAYDALRAEPPRREALDALSAEVGRALQSIGGYLDPELLSLPARQKEELERGAAEISDLKSRLADGAAALVERDRRLAEREVLIARSAEQARSSEAARASLQDSLREALDLLATQTRIAAEKESIAADRERELAEKSRAVALQTEWLREKDDEIARAVLRIEELDRALTERDGLLTQQAERLSEREAEIARAAARIVELDLAAALREREIAEKAGEIAFGAARMEELGRRLAISDEALVARERELADLSALSADQARLIAEKETALARQAGRLGAQAEELKRRMAELEQAAADVAALTARLGEKEAALSGALTGLAKHADLLTRLEEDHRLLTAEAGVLRERAVEREAELSRREGELGATLRTLEEMRSAIGDLEASLDRQRTHLAVLSWAPRGRHG